MTQTKGELPNGWESSTLGDVADFIMGQAPPGADCNKSGNGTVFVKAGEFGQTYPVVREWTTKPLKFANSGDVLICVVGATAGKLNLGIDCAIGRSVAAIRPLGEISADFILAQLKPKVESLRASSVGSAQGVISKVDLANIEFAVPPLNEQCHIAARIEALMARSQRVKEALKAIRPLLDQFRQSVLAAAFRGDLTADWREKNSDVEPASVFLERIRRDHRQNKALEEIDLATLPELPESWCWARLGEVSVIQGGIQKQPKRVPNKNAYPFLRVANVPRGRLNLDNVHRIELFGNELEKLRLYKGDLLIVEGNGSPSEIGRMAIWDGSIKDCVHQNHLIRVRLDKEITPEFVEAYWNAPQGRFRVFDVAHTTTGLYTLSVSKIAKLPVPLAPEAEQVALMQILKKLFKIETYVQATIMQSEEELDSLDQSILAKAFRGKLVSQDPNDEPASVLLERILAERAKREAEAKVAKKSTGKTSGQRGRKAKQQDLESIHLGLPGLE